MLELVLCAILSIAATLWLLDKRLKLARLHTIPNRKLTFLRKECKQCIGNPLWIRFRKPNATETCLREGTVLVVLNSLDEDPSGPNEEEVIVSMCPEHFRETEKIQAAWMAKNPGNWRNGLIAMDSPTRLRYTVRYTALKKL